ncbi:restriction endonuclease subunit S, partial [uncultured Brachyspira sp.]
MKKWQEVKLGDIVYFNPSEKLIKGNYYKKISMDCLLPHTRKINRYKINIFNGGSKFRNGDTLMARITPCLENGKTAQVSILEKNEVGFGSTEFIVLRGKENITYNDFIYYLFNTDYIRNTAIKSMTGTSGRQRVEENVLKNIIIKLPSLPEQQKIASFLTSADELIDAERRKLEALKKYKKGLMQKLFPRDGEKVPEMRFPEFQTAGEWEEKKLEELCSIKKGEQKNKLDLIENGKYPVLNGG